MALFDRNDDRGWRGMDDDHLRRDYENRSSMDAGGDYRGMNRPLGNRGREREGLWANSWSDGAWTADAANRTERDWHLGEGHGRYDRDIRPAEAGWRAGGMSMNRGGTGMDRGRGWNPGGDRDRGHDRGGGNPDRGYMAGGLDRDRDWSDRGMDRGGNFLDRTQNAIRRGWDYVEDRLDRDDDRMHMGGGAMRGGTSWAGNYDREFGMRGDSGMRGYRDDQGPYGMAPRHEAFEREHLHGAGGYGGGGYGSGGMNRYGRDFERGLDRDLENDRGFRA
ncbi:MAG TPA: hypothetical protein VHG93_12290, partial [Longimicrobium sp.]|nr:hypothetical protein [Longimicrobium sp.]